MRLKLARRVDDEPAPALPDARFAVIFYNLAARIRPTIRDIKDSWRRVRRIGRKCNTRSREFEPEGGTDHTTALQMALELNPEVILFLTDAHQID